MPKESDHCAKYERNSNFVKMDSLKESFKEWYVTGVFYCSVHLIEGYLDHFRSQDTTNHRERLDIIKSDGFLRKILSDYSLIYHESLKARYYNKEFTDDDIENIDRKIKNIEHTLCPIVKQANNRKMI